MKYKASKIYLLLSVISWLGIFAFFTKTAVALSDGVSFNFELFSLILCVMLTILFTSLNSMSLKVENMSKEIEELKSKLK